MWCIHCVTIECYHFQFWPRAFCAGGLTDCCRHGRRKRKGIIGKDERTLSRFFSISLFSSSRWFLQSLQYYYIYVSSISLFSCWRDSVLMDASAKNDLLCDVRILHAWCIFSNQQIWIPFMRSWSMPRFFIRDADIACWTGWRSCSQIPHNYNWTALRAGIGPRVPAGGDIKHDPSCKNCWRSGHHPKNQNVSVRSGTLRTSKSRVLPGCSLTRCWMRRPQHLCSHPWQLQQSYHRALRYRQRVHRLRRTEVLNKCCLKNENGPDHAFPCRRLSSSVEIEVQVPVQVSQGVRRSSNFANLSQDTADTPGISWGRHRLRCSIVGSGMARLRFLDHGRSTCFCQGRCKCRSWLGGWYLRRARARACGEKWEWHWQVVQRERV